MNKKIIALAVAAGLATPMMASAEVETKWFGFTQITAQKLDQNSTTTPAKDGLAFGADRVRIGFKVKDGNVFGKLQVDFNKDGTNILKEIIKDAEAGYKLGNHQIKAGLFKTPVGMDFNTSGKKLDITKRGMEKKFVLERAAGVMFSGRKLSGFGYDVFFGNPSSRGSGVVDDNTNLVGAANTTAVRAMYDMGNMHFEVSKGTSEQAGGVGTQDYDVTNVAFKYKSGPLNVKAEYIDGQSWRGNAGNDEEVYYLHGGYMMNKTTELVARHYAADHSGGTNLTNTYLGVNFFLGSNKTNGRLQLNYVLAGGDKANYNGNGGGYTDNAILAQYQVSF